MLPLDRPLSKVQHVAVTMLGAITLTLSVIFALIILAIWIVLYALGTSVIWLLVGRERKPEHPVAPRPSWSHPANEPELPPALWEGIRRERP